jgi:cytidine deaminase
VDDALTKQARQAKANAYAPYSGYLVGAALEAADGTAFAGANVESASLGLTLCAERVALGAAVAAGARRFRRIVVVTESSPPAAPCGACRQMLAEFGTDLVVDAVGLDDTLSWRLDELLPHSFGPEDLAK